VFVLLLKLLRNADGDLPRLATTKKVENAQIERFLSGEFRLSREVKLGESVDKRRRVPFVKIGVQLKDSLSSWISIAAYCRSRTFNVSPASPK
jgi:hypothetical protein